MTLSLNKICQAHIQMYHRIQKDRSRSGHTGNVCKNASISLLKDLILISAQSDRLSQQIEGIDWPSHEPIHHIWAKSERPKSKNLAFLLGFIIITLNRPIMIVRAVLHCGWMFVDSFFFFNFLVICFDDFWFFCYVKLFTRRRRQRENAKCGSVIYDTYDTSTTSTLF